MLKQMVRLIPLLMAVVLTGCVKSTFTINYPLNGATYVGSVNEAPPVNDGSAVLMQSEFKISYTNNPGGGVDILLNGHNITQYFVFGPTSATADIELIKQHFRQGKNTFSVDPLGFGPSVIFNVDNSGPVIVITRGEVVDSGANLEVEGYLRDFSPVNSTLEMDLVDILGYSSSGTIQRAAAETVSISVDASGHFCAGTAKTQDNIDLGITCDSKIDISAYTAASSAWLYSFRARDIYGYLSEKEYLADSNGTGNTLPIQNAVRVAVGDSFIESMRPIIAAGIYNTLSAAPIDARCLQGAADSINSDTTDYATSGNTCAKWNDPRICGSKRGVYPNQNITQLEFDALDLADSTADPQVKDGYVDGRLITDAYYTCDAADAADWNADGGRLPTGLNDVAISLAGLNMNAWVQRFYMHDGQPKTVGGEDLDGLVGTMLLNGLKVKSDNVLDVDMIITEMVVRLEIPGTLNVDLGMYIKRIVVDTEAFVQAVDKDMDVQLQNSNFALEGVKMDDAEACLWIICIPLDGIANALMPALEGMIGDLLPSILNPILEENLNKLVIGGTMTQGDLGTQFDMLLNIETLGTDTVTGDSYDMLVGLESLADVGVPDPTVVPSLGPIFFDDPIDPANIFNAYGGGNTNLSVAVNSNLINQTLNAIYGVGASHFTMYNGKTYYGGQLQTPVDKSSAQDADGQYAATTAVEGDTRVRLWPDMPPTVLFNEIVGANGAARAAIAYEAATLSFDVLRKNASDELVWETDVELEVDFDFAVTINETSDGVFRMGAAGPPAFNINKMINHTNLQVPQVLVQGILDAALFIGGDVLADKYLELDLGALAAGTINGTEVVFLSDQDNYTQDPGECLRYDENGDLIVPDPVEQPASSDNAYDTICQTIEFVINTNVVGVTGEQGTNLWFQMEARDPKIPGAPAIPKMDLDDDGVLDYQDNCKVSTLVQTAAIQAAGGLAGNIDENGNPIGTFEDDVKGFVSDIYSAGEENNSTVLNDPAAVIALPDASPTSTEDRDWYDTLRVDDLPIASSSPTWVRMLFSNPNQYNSDGDRLGELCEDDADRDGVYTDNGEQDNCPASYNPGQEDTYGVVGEGSGDACNIRQTFILLKSKTRGQCISHENFSNTYAGGAVDPSLGNSSNGFRYTVFKACDQADPGQRFYFKENTAPTGAAPPANAAVAQLWQTESRDNFFLATAVDSGGNPDLPADDIVVTNHANYGDGTQYNDWIFYASGDPDYPYLIKSYKFYTRDYPAASDWCIFDKYPHTGHLLPDQDANSCSGGNDSNSTVVADSPKFQLLLGPEMAPWTGAYD